MEMLLAQQNRTFSKGRDPALATDLLQAINQSGGPGRIAPQKKNPGGVTVNVFRLLGPGVEIVTLRGFRGFVFVVKNYHHHVDHNGCSLSF